MERLFRALHSVPEHAIGMNWRKENFSKIIEQIPVGVAITRPDGTLEYANPRFCRMTGARSHELAGVPLSRFVHPLPAPAQAEPADASQQEQPRCREARIHNGAGTIDILESVHTVHDHAGAVTHFLHLLQDVSARKVLQAITRPAQHVSHGLPAERQDRPAAGRPRNAYALLCMNIDHFKQIDDAMGHDTRDELLREVGARLTHALRASDSVAYWGADEFVVLLQNLGDRRAVARVTRKLIAACSGPYALGGGTRYVTLRIGYSLFPSDARDIVSLLRRARQAMQVLKDVREGRQALLIAQ